MDIQTPPLEELYSMEYRIDNLDTSESNGFVRRGQILGQRLVTYRINEKVGVMVLDGTNRQLFSKEFIEKEFPSDKVSETYALYNKDIGNIGDKLLKLFKDTGEVFIPSAINIVDENKSIYSGYCPHIAYITTNNGRARCIHFCESMPMAHLDAIHGDYISVIINQ